MTVWLQESYMNLTGLLSFLSVNELNSKLINIKQSFSFNER